LPGAPADTPSLAARRDEIEQVVIAAAALKAVEAVGESERRILWQTRT
jgi:hypothetical protein